ncbi:hypothetical protein [Gemmata sp.]|uniref:hypothetical protein n=1 Tax=Gemmata sp. TaxID=1914242 RepID=UPI003F7055BA
MARQRKANPDAPLTEADWVAADNPHTLLHHIRASASHRKLRLFACACCQPLVDLINRSGGKTKLAATEQYADGLITEKKYLAAFNRIRPPGRGRLQGVIWFAFAALGWPDAEGVNWGFDQATEDLVRGTWAAGEHAEHHTNRACLHAINARTLLALGDVNDDRPSNAFRIQMDAEKAECADLFREVFGNPFRPIAFNADWRTDTVVSLATAAYESRDFSTLPILADALQDAGCDADDLLAHCRDPKQAHVRGCWALDLVLGKA